MEKLVVRTGGLRLFSFGLLDSFLIVVQLLFFYQFQRQLSILNILVCLIMILLIVNLTVYILINKIELTNDYMRIRILSRNQLIPLRKDVIRLNVSDIKRILLGKENFLHETLKNNKKYIHEINMFYSKYGFRWYPTGVHSVSKNISMLVILTNDGQLSIASTNHFSKNNIRKLINELKKRNLNVLVG